MTVTCSRAIHVLSALLIFLLYPLATFAVNNGIIVYKDTNGIQGTFADTDAGLTSALSLAASSPKGATVFIPAATAITVTSTHTVGPSIMIEGYGGATPFSSGVGGATIQMDSTKGSLDVFQLIGDNVAFRNVCIKHDDTTTLANTTGSGVDLNAHQSVWLENVCIQNNKYGIYNSSTSNAATISMDHATIRNTTNAFIYSDATHIIDGIYIHGCLMQYSSGEGLHYVNTNTSTINCIGSSRLEYCKKTIITASAPNVYLDHLEVDSGEQSCVDFYQATRGALTNSIVHSAGIKITTASPWSSAWSFDYTDANRQNGGTTGAGVNVGTSSAAGTGSIDDADDIRIASNSITYCGGHGIHVGGDSITNVIIHDNAIYTNGRKEVSSVPTYYGIDIEIGNSTYTPGLAGTLTDHVSVTGNRSYIDSVFGAGNKQKYGLVIEADAVNYLRVRNNDFKDTGFTAGWLNSGTGTPVDFPTVIAEPNANWGN